MRNAIASVVLAVLGAVTSAAHADEAAIRRNLPALLPELPTIDAVQPSPLAGLWEVRMGTELVYTDADGHYVLEGDLIDARKHVNLTQERETALKAFDFRRLPLEDAVTWKRGNGQRHLVVFADPNCGYCRQLEKSLNDVKNVTVHTFLIPILGDDSIAKARAIWCAPAANRGQLWRDWMTQGKAPPAAPGCDASALDRNLVLQQRHGVTGTPSLVFEDNDRIAGVVTVATLEKKFASLRPKAR